MASLVLKPGLAYEGTEIHLPGYSEGYRHVIPGFSTVAAANIAGFRYFRRSIAASWEVTTERKFCLLHSWNHDPYTGKKVYRDSDWGKLGIDGRPMATMEYCPYPNIQTEIYRPCEFCVWITARDRIFDMIGDRPIRPTTATPAIDARGRVYGWRCHSGNHVWTSFEDADRCCIGRYQRGIGEWIPILAEVSAHV